MKPGFDNLKRIGWNNYFQTSFQSCARSHDIPARILQQDRNSYTVCTERGELMAQVSGKLRFEAESAECLPAVGDWVVIRPRYEEHKATIFGVLPRKSQFVRKAAGERTEAQVVGANIDTVFLVTSLNQNFSLRRIERYLVAAWESRAYPVIVLSKADLCADCDKKVDEVQSVARGVPIHVISVFDESGLGGLTGYLTQGQTVALLGSSGVGKSTLINYLLGEEVQAVQTVREQDSRGKHTTTRRQLILLPGGGLVLDTPGMRELQLWDVHGGIETTFNEIDSLAKGCHFRDCRHQEEPGCAVRKALEEQAIDPVRYLNYEKLQKELRYMELKRDRIAQMAEKKKWKKLSKEAGKRADSKRRGY